MNALLFNPSRKVFYACVHNYMSTKANQHNINLYVHVQSNQAEMSCKLCNTIFSIDKRAMQDRRLHENGHSHSLQDHIIIDHVL